MILQKKHHLYYNLEFLATKVYIYFDIDHFKKKCLKMKYSKDILDQLDPTHGKCLEYSTASGHQEIYIYAHHLPVVVHEITHAVTFIMERYNIVDDEFRAYMTDFLFQLSFEFLDSESAQKNYNSAINQGEKNDKK